MKPLNRDEPGCNYTSSNCVIWQGPDIPCIYLCKGDSVSGVIYKLATELCAVLDTLNVETYDLSCLKLACAPANFHDFIQILVQKICDLQACCNGQSDSGTTTVLNSVIPVAPCFYYTNPFGDLVTTMTLSDYATASGNRICSIEIRLLAAEQTISNQGNQINSIQQQVNNPAPVVLPLVTPSCVLPPFPTPMNIVLQAVEEQFCTLLGATGSPTEIYEAIVKQCANLGTQQVLGPGGGNMNGIPGWNNLNNNLAASINNIWLGYCDMRAAIQSIQLNCCPKGCDGIFYNLLATFDGATNVTIFLTGTIPAPFNTCSPLGTLVTISDQSGNSITSYMPIISFINVPGGFVITVASTPLVLTDNLTVHMEPCLFDSATGSTCQTVLNYTIVNQANCPVMVYTPTTSEIGYSGTPISGTVSYAIELWDALSSTLLSTQVQVITAPTIFTGTFIGLIPNTTYTLRVVATMGTSVVECPFVSVPLLVSVIPPVPLGGAAAFALLGGTGITNGVGASTIVGSVGSDPTVTIVNIVPGDVTGGTLYTVLSPVVQNAKTDLTNAIVYAGAVTPYVTLAADAIDGATFLPGYYDTPFTTITLAANATFDGGGDPNAVFIMHASTIMTIGAGATITLINGAQYRNIFWLVDGATTIGAAAFFKGIVLGTGNITVGIGATIDGSLFSNTGGVNTDTNLITF